MGVPAVIAGAAVGLGAYTAEQQSSLAEESNYYNQEQIRGEQVQLRIQAAQQSIAQTQHLIQVTAQSEVELGARGIAPDSGTVRAIFNHNYGQYDEDVNASRLNLQEQETGLTFKSVESNMQEHSQVENAWLGFGKNAIQSAGYLAASELPTGKESGDNEAPGIGAYNDAGYFDPGNPFDLNEGT